MSINNLINTLGWDSLHDLYSSFKQQCLTRFFMDLLISAFHRSSILHYRYIGRHDHQLKYYTLDSSLHSYKFSFHPPSIYIWNQLPTVAIFTSSIIDSSLHSYKFSFHPPSIYIWNQLPTVAIFTSSTSHTTCHQSVDRITV